MELTVPPHFAGPIPHARDEFDEALYVLSGRCWCAATMSHGKRYQAHCSWPLAGTGMASAIRPARAPWVLGI